MISINFTFDDFNNGDIFTASVGGLWLSLYFLIDIPHEKCFSPALCQEALPILNAKACEAYNVTSSLTLGYLEK